MSRNVVLITVDSLRADHCGFLAGDGPGGDHDLTPTLDELAEDSLVFERAFAPGPRTPSSIPAVLTGEFFRPTDLDVYENWEEKSREWKARRRRIGNHMKRFRTVAERMKAKGYATAAVTANPWTVPDTNCDAGFDEFYAIDGPDTDETSWYAPLTSQLGEKLGIDWGDVLLTWTDYYDTVRRAREALDEPYFLWVFLMDPHQPYIAPRRYRSENTGVEMLYANARYNYAHGYTENLPSRLFRLLQQAYRDTVRSIDGFIRRYRTDYVDDDFVTVFHADHGEAFQEHGTLGHRPHLYGENVHVPLLVHGLDTSERIEQPVSLRSVHDIVPKVGVDNLKPKEYTREFAISRTEECERLGVRSMEWAYQTSAEDWEYVYNGDTEELYWLATDPIEQENLSGEYPEASAVLRKLIDRHRSDARERMQIAESIDATTVRKVRPRPDTD